MRESVAHRGNTSEVGTAATWWRRVKVGGAPAPAPAAAKPAAAQVTPEPRSDPTPPRRSVSPDVVIRATDSDAHVLALIQADTLDRNRPLIGQIRERIRPGGED